MGAMYSEGRGVTQDTNKATDFFEAGLQGLIKYIVDFSEIREGLPLALLREDLPKELDELVSHYENIEADPEQKYQFSLDYIARSNVPDQIERGYQFLEDLVARHNHSEAAYELAKWNYANKNFSLYKSYVYAAASQGFIDAQFDMGASYFFKNEPHFSKMTAYSMFYRAYQAGKVTDEQLSLVEEQLYPQEIAWGREEAERESSSNLR